MSTLHRLLAKKLRAVTLVELLLVLAIFPIILLLLANVFSTFLDAQLRAVAQSSLDLEQQYLVQKLSDDIWHATSITTPTTDGETASELVLVKNGATIRYASSSGTLMRSAAASSAAVTSGQIVLKNFSVQRLGNLDGKTSIKLTVALAGTASAQQLQTLREFTTTITRR